MNVYVVNPKTKSIQTTDFDGQMTSIYSYFDSLLVDDSIVLQNHIIYTNAQHTDDNMFFIGEQLFIGNALILGLNNLEETDASIKQEELKSLISYDINDFYIQVIQFILKFEINIYDTFSIKNDNETLQLNFEWVIYTFSKADEKTRYYFLNELYKNSINKDSAEQCFQKMAQLAINAAKYQ